MLELLDQLEKECPTPATKVSDVSETKPIEKIKLISKKSITISDKPSNTHNNCVICDSILDLHQLKTCDPVCEKLRYIKIKKYEWVRNQ